MRWLDTSPSHPLNDESGPEGPLPLQRLSRQRRSTTRRARLRLSLTTVVLAHVAFCISYVAIVVRARLAGFDRSLEEAAADLGAGPWETFRRVTLPLLLPGVAAGALLVFTVSLDDYVVTSFVAGVGSTTLPLQIYSMLKVGVTPEVNAVSTLLLVLTVVLIAVAQRLQRGPRVEGQPR